MIRSRPAQLFFASSVITLGAIFATSIAGQTIGARFLASLRIAKPKPVVVGGPAAGAGNPSRQLQTIIAGILAETTTVAVDEADAFPPSIDSASRVAGFAARTLTARPEAPVIEVLGAHRIGVRLNGEQLRTLLVEAGRTATVPESLDGAPITLSRPRAIRLQYGHCPAPVANTLQNQIQGPPPPSTDNGNCVILTQAPVAFVAVPVGLDTGSVMEIALELSGMSPNQTRDFRSLFDWPSALAVSLPRAMRSYQIVDVAGARGMLMISAGRREPAYMLVWIRDGVVYTIAGYGSSGDAVPLAASVH